MAMKRWAFILFVLMAFAPACGADEPDEEVLEEGDCEGESLRRNFKVCLGEDAWWDEYNDLSEDETNQNFYEEDPAPDDLHLCDSENVVHWCNFDPEIHDGECRWWVGNYDGEENGEPTLYCSCYDAEFVTEGEREHCG